MQRHAAPSKKQLAQNAKQSICCVASMCSSPHEINWNICGLLPGPGPEAAGIDFEYHIVFAQKNAGRMRHGKMRRQNRRIVGANVSRHRDWGILVSI
jgi:hypothetical protein